MHIAKNKYYNFIKMNLQLQYLPTIEETVNRIIKLSMSHLWAIAMDQNHLSRLSHKVLKQSNLGRQNVGIMIAAIGPSTVAASICGRPKHLQYSA